ncbi:methylenetetrahydrofolate reductase [NAD(P)H] [Clostridium sp. B9]|uniref:methylenetetrahydrofolate reductase [NAD(P)H] n=1 Tax=Clostridium sp. B9 TaxID=3423224 RepID=UPI003D2F34A1
MKIKEIFNKKEFVLSFEVFPPKETTPIENIYNTLENIQELRPDFISVTYGAGGNFKSNRTIELASIIKNRYELEALAHLTCIGAKRNDIEDTLTALKNSGIENVLALRGDKGLNDIVSDYDSSIDLVKHIKDFKGINIGGACYPEIHPEATNRKVDLDFLKRKVDAGAEHLISQLFFDNNTFFEFLEYCEIKGINVPIQAGVMPVVNKKQIERILSLCKARFPKKFMKIVNKYEHDKEALRDAGIAYATEQIIDLISSGVRGVHLYTMNNSYVARNIVSGTRNIIDSVNKKEEVS